jgi:hypothetical protein
MLPFDFPPIMFNFPRMMPKATEGWGITEEYFLLPRGE